MKTAIICDWLVHPGGAEKVLGELLHVYPDADVFAVIDFVDEKERGFLHQKNVKTTFIQRLPFVKSRYRSYLPLMPLAIEQLDLSDYSLVISSSHAIAKGVLTGPDQLHISYVHSPMRYAWDLQHQYLRESGLDEKMTGYLARYFLHQLRLWDLRSANGVDYFASNSKFIAKRIMKTYRRNATVIYPPIHIEQFTPKAEKENYYLTASRLVPYKRIDLIVESFRSLPNEKLIVIGDGPEMKKIKALAGSNVEILGYQPDDSLIHYMQHAKAFIFAAEEDFGIIPLEAQACGTPIIAFGKGGALETVIGLGRDKPTGVFFKEQTTDAMIAGIQDFLANQSQLTMENCTANAARFSPDQFRTEFKTFVDEKIADFFSSP